MTDFFDKKLQIFISVFLNLDFSLLSNNILNSLICSSLRNPLSSNGKINTLILLLFFVLFFGFKIIIIFSHQNAILNKLNIILVRVEVFSEKLSGLLRVPQSLLKTLRF